MKSKCFSMLTAENKAVISVYDVIDNWAFRDFQAELAGLGEVSEIELRLNTPGGSVIDGFAMFNLLVQHPATVRAYVDGIAASMGSILAMAADEIIMPSNAFLMIHNPWSVAMGDAEELRSTADLLDKMKGNLIKAYQRHTSLDADELSAIMDAETWLTGDEAKEQGFIDEVLEPLDMAAKVDMSSLNNVPEAAIALMAEEEKEEVKEDVPEETDKPEESKDEPEVEEPTPEADPEPDKEKEEVKEEEPEVPEADPTAIAYDEGVLAGETKGRMAALVEVETQIEELRAEVNASKQELDELNAHTDSVEDERDALADSVKLAKEQIAKLGGAFCPTGESVTPVTWEAAQKMLGYPKAKKEYPALYEAFMDDNK